MDDRTARDLFEKLTEKVDDLQYIIVIGAIIIGGCILLNGWLFQNG